MSPTTTEDLPIYFLSQLAGNDLAHLNPVQQWGMDHLFYVQGFWWLVYTFTLTYVASKYILVPLCLKWCRKSPPSPRKTPQKPVKKSRR